MTDQQAVRRLRIVSNPGDVSPRAISVWDADTGERISHAFRAIVTLDVNEINQVELFYYKADEQGRITVDKDMEPVICSVVVKNPEIDVMALEARKEQPRDTTTKESKASGRSCGMD